MLWSLVNRWRNTRSGWILPEVLQLRWRVLSSLSVRNKEDIDFWPFSNLGISSQRLSNFNKTLGNDEKKKTIPKFRTRAWERRGLRIKAKKQPRGLKNVSRLITLWIIMLSYYSLCIHVTLFPLYIFMLKYKHKLYENIWIYSDI